jgi:hypothetical protein
MTSKAVEQVVNVLKSFLPVNIYALDFTLEHYKTLINTLQISNDAKSFDLKRGTLIEGITEYFKLSAQNVTVSLTHTHCLLKKQFMDNTASEIFDRTVHGNTQFLMELATRKDDFQTVPYLLVLPEDIRNIVFQIFLDNRLSIEKTRKLVRLQLQSVFNLTEKDVVFFLRGRIWIRYHSQPKATDGRDNRYAGESAEELEAMYNAYFPYDLWEEIEVILNEILEEKLNFSIIENTYFTKTFITVFRGMIEVLLIDTLKPNDHPKIEGFTGYVLRQYFDKILLHTAKNLLNFVENRDKNAEIFIRNFTDSVVIDANGTKIQKYAIVDMKQQRWNYTSILSILMQYKQAKLKITTQKESIYTAKQKVIACEVDLKSETNAQHDQEKNIENVKKLLAESDLAYFNSKKHGYTSLLTSQARRHEELLSDKKNEENTLDMIKNRIMNKIIELKRRRQRVSIEIKAYESLMEQLTPVVEAYDNIAHGLAVVLTKR